MRIIIIIGECISGAGIAAVVLGLIAFGAIATVLAPIAVLVLLCTLLGGGRRPFYSIVLGAPLGLIASAVINEATNYWLVHEANAGPWPWIVCWAFVSGVIYLLWPE